MAMTTGRGSARVILRIEEDLMDELDAAVLRSQSHRKGIAYTVSSFIRAAIKEKIAHNKRTGKRTKIGKPKKEYMAGSDIEGMNDETDYPGT